MGDGRQQPENGKGLGFEASARSERRFRDPFAPDVPVEALHVSRPIGVVLLAHSCGFALAAFRGRGRGGMKGYRTKSWLEANGAYATLLACL
jgi:hypothetical protein